MASSHARGRARPDATFYPSDDDMGESILQRFLTELLRALIVRLFASRGVRAFVGANQFIYWVKGVPTRNLAPDVYVLPGVAPNASDPCWKTWELGFAPSFAFEMVSLDWPKDYLQGPARYAEMGARELVVFDPDAHGPERFRWQVFRMLPKRGFVRVEATNADRVRSRALSCWLRVTGEGGDLRVRIGLGPHGDELLPSDAELAAQAATAVAAERERADAAAQRADAAEAEVARLRAELTRARKRR